MNDQPDLLPAKVFQITKRILKAFDAVYADDQRYVYNVLCLRDRDGNDYVWAQQQPDDLTPPFTALQQSQFIDSQYALRPKGELPGEHQEWHVPVPSGTQIYYLPFRMAKKSSRWASDVEREEPDKTEFNALFAELVQEYQQSQQALS